MPSVATWESNEKGYVARMEGQARKSKRLPLLQAESIREKINVVDRVEARCTDHTRQVGVDIAAQRSVPHDERAAWILRAAGFMATVGLRAAVAGMFDQASGAQSWHHQQRPEGYNAYPGPFHISASLVVRANPIKGPL